MNRQGRFIKYCRAVLGLVLSLWLSLPGAGNSRGDKAKDWEKNLLKSRLGKDTEFKKFPQSPLAAVRRIVVLPGKECRIARKGDTLVSAGMASDADVLIIVSDSEGWAWETKSQGVTDLKGEPVLAGRLNRPMTFRYDRFTLSTYPGTDHLGIIVFDPQAETIRTFSHLNYYSPDRHFSVPAELEKLAYPERVALPTTRGLKKNFYRYARIHFHLDGQACILTAFKSALSDEDAATLFIPFRDQTTGDETYGVGRFLEIPDPVQDRLTLDFNLAFNPLCNYSPAYNCPRPPEENQLAVAIRAGEKTYGENHP